MKKTELVVKSNQLVEASYRLSLTEQRIILYAISRSREEQLGLSPGRPVTISADAFAKQFSSVGKGTVYQQLNAAMDTLFDRFVTIRDTYPGTNSVRISKTRWISTASYVDGEGLIQVIFAPEVVEYITRLEGTFTRYRLDRIGEMTSSHAVRLYELLIQYRKTGERDLSLTWLREKFQMAPDEYKLTADFIKRVIDVAVNQINQHSDIQVSYQTKKTGRAISHFSFKIKSKNNEPVESDVADDQAYREKLEANGQQRLDEEASEVF